MTHQKESAVGCDTTTTDTNSSDKIISFCALFQAAIVRYALILISFLLELSLQCKTALIKYKRLLHGGQ